MKSFRHIQKLDFSCFVTWKLGEGVGRTSRKDLTDPRISHFPGEIISSASETWKANSGWDCKIYIYYQVTKIIEDILTFEDI